MFDRPIESPAAFDARIIKEEAEARTVICPLDTCRAQIDQPCHTEAGEERIRHCRRLWVARKKSDSLIVHAAT